MAESSSPLPAAVTPPPPPPPPPPPIAALFVVAFDHRRGNVLRWHRSLRRVAVEGAVEFACLPSGLHRVREDVVYFVSQQQQQPHRTYAGVAACVNRADAAAARGAVQLAVGVLVPGGGGGGGSDGGRMGKSWRHAERLSRLAEQQISHDVPAATKLQLLDAYWQEHRLVGDDDDEHEGEIESAVSVAEADEQEHAYAAADQSMSLMSSFLLPDDTPAAGPTDYGLSPHHPAARLLDLLQAFGPLIFPLYRAALLRRRILLVTEAPVELACNMVYNLSVLSSLPRSLLAYLPLGGQHGQPPRIPALFNVGLADIDYLAQQAFPDGWIACTTDDVLATKPQLYDVVVHLPSRDSSNAAQKVYPRILVNSREDAAAAAAAAAAKQHQQPPSQTRLLASQRDAVRYAGFRRAIKPFPRAPVLPASSQAEPRNDDRDDRDDDDDDDDDDDGNSTLSGNAPSLQDQQDLVEPSSWSRVAYTSLLWWASAGDRRNGLTADEEEQMERDALLFDRSLDDDGAHQSREVVVVGYFRRLTATIFQAVHEVLRQEQHGRDVAVDGGRDDADENGDVFHDTPGHEDHGHGSDEADPQRPLLAKPAPDDDGDDDETLVFTADDLSAMGLDVWSRNDGVFVEELLRVWWRRRARVSSGHVECCGIRIL